MESPRRPLSLFGVSLKKLLVAVAFVSILVVVINPGDIRSFFSRTLTTIQLRDTDKSAYDRRDAHIDATPEMISEAIRELSADRMREHEKSETRSPNERFYYIIELHDGGDLDASAIVIEPDLVTIVSQSGIKTVLPRTAIKKINRYKLPDLPRPAE